MSQLVRAATAGLPHSAAAEAELVAAQAAHVDATRGPQHADTAAGTLRAPVLLHDRGVLSVRVQIQRLPVLFAQEALIAREFAGREREFHVLDREFASTAVRRQERAVREPQTRTCREARQTVVVAAGQRSEAAGYREAARAGGRRSARCCRRRRHLDLTTSDSKMREIGSEMS